MPNRADLYTGGLYSRSMFQRQRHPRVRPKAVICDVDGTLCNVESIRHFVLRPKGEKDFDSFHAASANCPPIQQALDYCARQHKAGFVICVVTARMQKHYAVTKAWLEKNMVVPYDGPFHAREDGDHRSDALLKKRLYHYLSRNYDIRGAIDDRPEVVQLWRSLGLDVEVVEGWNGKEVE